MKGSEFIRAANGSGRGEALYIRLADNILSYIKKADIRPGMRIPSERKLAEMFQTSRTSVREAVRILENKGILEIQIGNGMYLKETMPEDFCMIELWKTDYLEILDIKTILEFHIIEDLCRYVAPADLLAIESALKLLEEGYDQGIFDHQADMLFHKRIRACCKNQTLVQLIDNLLLELDTYGIGQESFRKFWFDTIPYHRKLYEAIVAHDVKKAHEAFYTISEIDKAALNVINKNKRVG